MLRANAGTAATDGFVLADCVVCELWALLLPELGERSPATGCGSGGVGTVMSGRAAGASTPAARSAAPTTVRPAFMCSTPGVSYVVNRGEAQSAQISSRDHSNE